MVESDYKNVRIFFFFPLASIGGTECVHTDILNVFKKNKTYTIIRYKRNVWKGMAWVNEKKYKSEDIAMLDVYKKYTKVIFASDFLEARRFGRFFKKYFIKFLSRKINNSKNAIIIFWHRESIEFILPFLNPHVKLIDIIHNNSNNDYPDAKYLINDFVPILHHRVAVNENLLAKWIFPLYKFAEYPKEYYSKISVINHTVFIPEKFPVKPDNGKLNVVYVGRVANEKRLNIWIEIAKLNFHLANFIMIGPQKSDFDIEIGDIEVTGIISDRKAINKYYENCHIIMMTSSSEGFPKTIAEAMAFGCIPIVTAVGGISGIINNQEDGFLISSDEKDIVESASYYIEYLSNNRNKLLEISRNCYLKAQNLFSEERFKKQWTNVIRS